MLLNGLNSCEKNIFNRKKTKTILQKKLPSSAKPVYNAQKSNFWCYFSEFLNCCGQCCGSVCSCYVILKPPSHKDSSLSLKNGSRREVMLGRQEEIKPLGQPGQYISFPYTSLLLPFLMNYPYVSLTLKYCAFFSFKNGEGSSVKQNHVAHNKYQSRPKHNIHLLALHYGLFSI